jgi:hypothetical protein
LDQPAAAIMVESGADDALVEALLVLPAVNDWWIPASLSRALTQRLTVEREIYLWGFMAPISRWSDDLRLYVIRRYLNIANTAHKLRSCGYAGIYMGVSW